MYLDHWLFKHKDLEALSLQITATLSLLDQPGFLVNLKKVFLTPSHVLEFVEVLYNLEERPAYKSHMRVEKIHIVWDLLQHHHKTAGN